MDAAQFGTGKVVVYTVPQVFQTYQIDLEIVCSQLSAHQTALTREFSSHHTPEEIFGIMIEEIVGMKACKASIKAGQSLSIIEMKHLVAEGMRVIPTMFVCQHGRPSIVKLSRQEIDGWVGR